MKRILTLLPLVLAATFLAASPAAADDRRCDGFIGATHVDGNVIVPNGATCTLRGTRVDGNTIDGNLQCKSNDPAPVDDNNEVSGNKENQCRGF